MLERLPDASADPNFDEGILEQYEQFRFRNASTTRTASAAVAEQRPPQIQHSDADVRFTLGEPRDEDESFN